jgi:16S rRNA (cytosine1402-N4)-methyltransferase
MEALHTTVLPHEAVEALNIKPNGVYIDATFGFGGHSKEILSKKDFYGHLIGIEVDKKIYDYAKDTFKPYKNLSLYNGNFVNVDHIALAFDMDQVSGILFDLGTNLFQIKESGRGFSFLKNEKLDMRLDLKSDLTAEKVVNSYTRERLEEILKNVDERFYRPIARRITESRRKKRIETTNDLVDIVRSVKYQKGKINPATLTFMALRIEVNNELENLKTALTKSIELLERGGRLVVISFHSGEDRIVKNFLRESAKEGLIKIINKKVIIPGRAEEIANPMSRSAKMRVAEVI